MRKTTRPIWLINSAHTAKPSEKCICSTGASCSIPHVQYSSLCVTAIRNPASIFLSLPLFASSIWLPSSSVLTCISRSAFVVFLFQTVGNGLFNSKIAAEYESDVRKCTPYKSQYRPHTAQFLAVINFGLDSSLCAIYLSAWRRRRRRAEWRRKRK